MEFSSFQIDKSLAGLNIRYGFSLSAGPVLELEETPVLFCRDRSFSVERSLIAPTIIRAGSMATAIASSQIVAPASETQEVTQIS